MDDKPVAPTAWAGELQFPKMALTEHLEQKLRAHLLCSYGESSFAGWPNRWNFWTLAFNAIAQELFQAGVLTEALLCEQIPVIVRDAGIASGLDPDRGGGPPLENRELAGRLKQRINYWVGRLKLAKPPEPRGSDGTEDDAEGPIREPGASEDLDSRKAERRKLLSDYKAECRQNGVKVTNEMIAKAASPKWSGRTQIQKWTACDPQYDGIPDRLIRAALRNKPHLRKTT